MTRIVTTQLNQQQCQLIARWRDERGFAGGDGEMLRTALLEFAGVQARPAVDRASGPVPPPAAALELGELREDILIQPISGVALPIDAGEVLRIVQEEDGGQCVDFNAFSRTDYKERLDAGRTRAYNGLFPAEGGLLYSNSPRDRVMFEIAAMPASCKSETIGARCNAVLFERIFGFDIHTNCQDTLAECIGEYGLTPDDVHDSFNLWMNTEIDTAGQPMLHPNTGRRGDHVDLLAVLDTISVPITCGSGDVFVTSNFALKPIRVQVFAASEQTASRARDLHRRFNSFRNQRTPAQFRVGAIRAERELERDPSYRPRFVNFPLVLTPVEVELSDDEYALLDDLRARGAVPDGDDGAVLRSAAILSRLADLRDRHPDVAFVLPDGPVDTVQVEL